MAALTDDQRTIVGELFPDILARVGPCYLRRFPKLRDEILSAVGLGVVFGVRSFRGDGGLSLDDWVELNATRRVRAEICLIAARWKDHPSFRLEDDPLWFARFDDDGHDRLDSLLPGLSPRQRDAVTLTILEGHPLEEASRRMGVSPNTCKRHRFDAIQRLKTFLKDPHARHQV